MLDPYKLELLDGDRIFVYPPSFVRSPMVRAYHWELLQVTRVLPYFFNTSTDEILFKAYKNLYFKIIDAWGADIPLEQLTPTSRHKLLIASTLQKDIWLCDLEIMMGYTAPSENIASPLVTTGSVELDLLAELLHLTSQSQVFWLINNFSTKQISLLVKQLSDRAAGNEAIASAQRERDLKSFEMQGIEALQQIGAIFPE